MLKSSVSDGYPLACISFSAYQMTWEIWIQYSFWCKSRINY